MSKIFTLKQSGIEVEIGKYARQADGAVWIKQGGNVVLSTVVVSKEEREFAGFFPLTVEYREKISAAGKIPGGYIKREGRLSDVEVLSSRLIDRPIRPLFPKYYFNEVQLMASVYSYDGKFPSSILGLLSASLALVISPIPFLGPVGAVKVGRLNGKFVFNPSYEDFLLSDVELIVAGTADGICMVEGHCNSLTESELAEVLFLAHEQIKEQVDWQLQIQKEVGAPKEATSSDAFWKSAEEKVKAYFKEDFCDILFVEAKTERNAAMKKMQEDLLTHFAGDISAGTISKPQVKFLFDSMLKDHLPDAVARKQKRFDGRGFDKVRPIESSVAILPTVHGSSVFQRGETQALASLTLGTAQDAQKVDSLEGVQERTFMLHYNFPPFATGEVKPIRSVGRREIGHGYLAEKSFNFVLPSQEEFPYTIRSVVDVLESNGSSSMATVCATTLAMMDAGVPIKNMVSGVAMGLMKDSKGTFYVLTDILGMEDALGLMDFKVTGTSEGIMAVQMDIKAKAGLTKPLLERALEQARAGRLHILKEMELVLAAPRSELSPLAPRVTAFKVPIDKIGAIIGPSGKSIKEIIAATNTQIDIEDDGTVRIYSQSSIDAKKAEQWVRTISGDIEVGAVFDGIVRRIAEFGIFVELVPGKDGLVHISTISREKQMIVEKTYRNGDILKVRVVAVDQETGRIRLIAPELEK